MSKLEENVNEILGIEKEPVKVSDFDQPKEMVEVKPNLPRTVEEKKHDIDHD